MQVDQLQRAATWISAHPYAATASAASMVGFSVTRGEVVEWVEGVVANAGDYYALVDLGVEALESFPLLGEPLAMIGSPAAGTLGLIVLWKRVRGENASGGGGGA